MKWYAYLLFIASLFMINSKVSAKEVTLDDMVRVINDGVITTEYLESKRVETDSETGEKLWENVVIRAYVEDGMLYVDGEFTSADDVLGVNIEAIVQEDGKTLKSVIYFDENQDGVNPDDYKYNIEIHNLIPLWEIEASDGWDEIKKYVEKDYINKLNTIIDRCYRQEMHACRTVVSTYGKHEYISDVELNEEPANYVIKKLEEEAKAAANDKFIAGLTVLAVVLIIILLMVKSLQPKAKAIKY